MISGKLKTNLLLFLAALGFVICSTSLLGCSDRGEEASSVRAEDAQNATIDLHDLVVFETDYSELEAEVQRIVDESIVREDTVVAVTFRGLDELAGGFDINGSVPMTAASMIKMAVLAELLEEIENGALSFDQTVVVASEDVVGGTGIGIYPGQMLTVRELANLMISESDNTASNALISLLGIDNINEHAAQHGLVATDLDHKLMAANITNDNKVSSNDLASIFEWIAEGELGSEDDDEAVSQFLIQQTDNEALSKGVLAPWTLGHKTGSLSYVRSDGGILYDATGDAACVLVVLTNHMDEYSANAMMTRIATVVCTYLDRIEYEVVVDSDDVIVTEGVDGAEFVTLR